MIEGTSLYSHLATREGFNSSVRHINATIDLLDKITPRNNIADEINNMLADKVFSDEGTLSAITMLLVQKAGYRTKSRNLSSLTSNMAGVIKEVSGWKAVDVVIGYHHPDLGYIVINPKNPESQPVLEGFRKNELVVVYAGADKGKSSESSLWDAAIDALVDLLEGRKAKIPAGLTSGSYSFVAQKKKAETKVSKLARAPKKPARSASAPSVSAAPPAAGAVSAPPPAPVAAPGAKKMSPLVSVVVTNELFHNGNVEAWKRIIRSFNARYPALQVHIYYDGERIVDINTLFKWGKVKHGSCIQFCVSGENIQDLAKLSRYFRQGASPQFEAFLHGSPDTVMNLF